MLVYKSFGAILLCLTTSSIHAYKYNELSRELEVVNESGESLDVDWLNPDTGEASKYGTARAGQSFYLNSYVNHTFVVHLPYDDGSNQTECSSSFDGGEDECRSSTYLTVTDEGKKQVWVVKEGLEVEHVDRETRKKTGGTARPRKQAAAASNADASAIVSACRAKVDRAMSASKKPPLGGMDAKRALDMLTTCLEDESAAVFVEKNEELAFQADLRHTLSGMAENYTCADPTREMTTPQEWRTWTHGGVTRNVGILHDRPASQIHVLKDFISEDECEAIRLKAAPTLHRGTVADGKGGSRLSENRKAWQAGVKVDWDKEGEGDHIAAVSRRLFDYANHVTGYGMGVQGQEDLMSIQYFGNGTQDPTPDRYTPHCDGDCDGLPHKTGGRVATMVMYCDVPTLGGGTNFQNANVFVKPQKGAAAFFSYLHPETRVHELHFTSHSGCPVLEGTKRIAVQWMRIGVDAENPWDSFDTLTIKKSSYKEDGDEDC